MPRRKSVNDINSRFVQQHASSMAGQTAHFSNPNPSYSQPAHQVNGEQFAGAAAYSRSSAVYSVDSKRKMSRGKKAAIIVVCSILVLLIGAGTAFGLYMNYISSQINQGDKSLDELAAIDTALGYKSNLHDVFYMMLIGTDKRPGEEGMFRSDTNIVARVDPKKDEVTLLSIPRDTKIEIEGYGTQKFNAAYAFNGAAGAIEAAEKLLGVDITHYAEVSFLELKGLVDAIGGVTVQVDSKIDNDKCDDGDGNHYVIEEGLQTLDGGAALTFARNRDYPQGDFIRQTNQRRLIEAIIDEVMDMPISKIPDVINAAAQCVVTDLSIIDIIGLAQQFADNDDIIMYSAMVPSYTQNINGISFVITDAAKLKEMLIIYLQGGDPSEIVSEMTAADITDKSVDTSKTLVFEDDPEVVSGRVKPNTNPQPSSSGTQSGQSGGNSGTGEDPGTSSGTGGNSGNGEGTTPSGSDAGNGTSGNNNGNAGDNTGSGSGSGPTGGGADESPTKVSN